MSDLNPWVDYSIERGPIRSESKSKVGLTLRIKARPELENFMRGLSNDNVVSVDAYAPDSWINLDTGGSFDVYQTDTKQLGNTRVSGYTLDHIGSGLLVSQNNRDDGGGIRLGNNPDLVNLAFLRLRGISTAENGLRIGIPGAYSSQYVLDVRNRYTEVLTRFLKDLIVPMTINVQIISR